MTREELEIYSVIPVKVNDYANSNAESNPRFVSWITTLGGEIVIRTFGYRRLFRRDVEVTEVMRTSPAFDGAIAKNIYYTGMAGYRVVFESKDIISRSVSYWGYGATLFGAEDFNRWFYIDKPYGFSVFCLNPAAIFELPKYRYCGYSQGNILEYLKAYDKNPGVEYLGKLGLEYKPSLMNKVKKDRGFIKFLKNNVREINLYGPSVSIYAYDHHLSFVEANKMLMSTRIKQRSVRENAPRVKDAGLDAVKVFDYCAGQKISLRIYNDYIDALINIGGFDMNDTKNAFPNDLMRMHDLRVNQWASLKAKKEAAKRKALERKFIEQAKKAAGFTYTDGIYAVVIPSRIKDLVIEGDMLHHCVGKMGYDAKMANGETLIVFIRKAEDLTKPYVTVEWKDNRVKQCYAAHDSKPDDETRKFVDEWAKWMNRKVA